MNDDLISRAAAIESIRECAEAARSNYEWDMEEGYLNAIECIEEEPSAQPEKAQLSGEDATSDCVSRQAAIDALKEAFNPSITNFVKAKIAIESLPSAQPEHMHTVMLKIKEKYEKAMNTPCINNPIAWALYQTWKEYDR